MSAPLRERAANLGDRLRVGSVDLRALRRTMERFFEHHLNDWGAALTFYAAVSLVPALVILAGILGLIGDPALDTLSDNLKAGDPGPARQIALGTIDQVRDSPTTAGIAVVVGIVGALWSASSYVGGFMRASGVINDREVRYPFWKLRPLQILTTGGVILAIAGIALAVVVTGALADEVASLVGLESAWSTAWDIVKWPVIAIVVMTIFATLYWAAPDSRGRGFRWITPGGLVATAAWVLGSGGYGAYVATVPNYNHVYGGLAAVIGFFFWLWLSNLAMLYGAELNAELERAEDR